MSEKTRPSDPTQEKFTPPETILPEVKDVIGGG